MSRQGNRRQEEENFNIGSKISIPSVLFFLPLDSVFDNSHPVIHTQITSSHDLPEFQMALNNIYMNSVTMRTGSSVAEASSDKQQQQQKKHKLQKE